MTQEPRPATPTLAIVDPTVIIRGKEHISGPLRLIIAVPDKRLAIVIDTAQNLTITGTGGKQATVIERADNGAPACSKRRGEAPWGLSDETAYSTQLI